jgi:hypothetical protein
VLKPLFVADIENRMQTRAAHIGVNNQNFRSGLRQTDRRIDAVVVFPSAGRLDVIKSDFGACPAVESKIEVRSWR